MLTKKLIPLLLAMSACADNQPELEPYACTAYIECWPKRDKGQEIFHLGLYATREDSMEDFGPKIHQQGLAFCDPDLYNTVRWSCEKIPYCSDLGCGPASYSHFCVMYGDCDCDVDGRGPEPTQQCAPDESYSYE